MKTTTRDESWELARDLRISSYEAALERLERLYDAEAGEDEMAEAWSLVRRLREEAARICS